jgi:hypothetical protein
VQHPQQSPSEIMGDAHPAPDGAGDITNAAAIAP